MPACLRAKQLRITVSQPRLSQREAMAKCCDGAALDGRWNDGSGASHSGALPGIQAAVANLQRSVVLDRHYLASLGYAVEGHCVCGIAVYVTARSGIDLSLVLIVSVTAAVLLIIMIPISLGGWGMREASFITLLAPLGVNSQDALLIGLLSGLMNLVSSVPGGLSLMADCKAVYRSSDRTMQSSYELLSFEGPLAFDFMHNSGFKSKHVRCSSWSGSRSGSCSV